MTTERKSRIGSITLRRRSLAANTAKVTGIVGFSGADLLFTPTDPQRRILAFNPPANVAVLNLTTFNQTLRDPLLATTPTECSGVISTAELAVSEQIHLSIDRAALPGDPLLAQTNAARIFGAAALRARVNSAIDPTDQPEHDRVIARIRARLGDDVYEAVRAEGQAMPFEHLIEYLALSARTSSDG